MDFKGTRATENDELIVSTWTHVRTSGKIIRSTDIGDTRRRFGESRQRRRYEGTITQTASLPPAKPMKLPDLERRTTGNRFLAYGLAAEFVRT